MRSGGREAVEEVLAAARPLAEVLWMRETEAGGFDTPERRAALEARVAEVTAAIGDEAVRRYYRQDFGDRAAPAVRADARRDRASRPRATLGRAGRRPQRRIARGRRGRAAPAVFAGDEPYVVASPQLAASPLHRGHRAAIPRREALILQTALNHPWLLHDHLEEFAEARIPPCRHRAGSRRR